MSTRQKWTTTSDALYGVITRVELIVVRDPDGDTTTRLFLDGREIPAATVTVDAGAGWHRDDWNTHRDSAVAAASCPAVATAIREAFTDPPGAEHITG
ncbi:hypothetical protein [Williamsia sp. CHRR-6]|uniref:hypothetical protein n=1 Tax=Williamsia sp. CHRR-6 TaxID=2835871 RepID=UPI001BD93060|nr:hypothetical protein [Williamsia sp. CHRR-6]MBT0568589.1 hypothetical protein [Williamsia sp. CHRR-6]